jgi:hypothetical protein
MRIEDGASKIEMRFCFFDDELICGEYRLRPSPKPQAVFSNQ